MCNLLPVSPAFFSFRWYRPLGVGPCQPPSGFPMERQKRRRVVIPAPRSYTHILNSPLAKSLVSGYNEIGAVILLCGSPNLLHRGAGRCELSAPCLYNALVIPFLILQQPAADCKSFRHGSYHVIFCVKAAVCCFVQSSRGGSCRPDLFSGGAGAGHPEGASHGTERSGVTGRSKEPRGNAEGWPGTECRDSSVGYADHGAAKRGRAAASYALVEFRGTSVA